MEQVENGISQVQDVAQSPATENAAPEQSSAEKTFTQSELNKIVGRVRDETRQETFNRAKQELEAQKQSSPSSLGGIDQVSPEKVNEMIENKLQERVQQAERQRTVHDFVNKIKSAESKYPALEEKVMKLNLAAAPHIFEWANSHDNTADIMNEFVENPNKYADVVVLSSFAPDAARQMMERLSSSIKQNQEALKQPTADEPLSQITSSTAGVDNGSMTLRDLKRQAWLRG